jgi:hypothetical protein
MILPAAAGWLDATAFLRVHTFAANMTGNTVLLALNAATGHGDDAALGGSRSWHSSPGPSEAPHMARCALGRCSLRATSSFW